MSQRKYTFPKSEKLCHRKDIESLYTGGHSFLVYPLLVHYQLTGPIAPPVKVVISVSKRRYARAVDRNLLKRRLREAYRLGKHDLALPAGAGLNLGLSYVGKEIQAMPALHKAMAAALRKLSQTIARGEPGA